MPRVQDDWSDSDEGEDGFDEEGYTSVHLGMPSDGIDVEDDIRDPYVSRIGGTPAFLGYPHPSPDASKCKVCNEPSELLVQLLCNLEESPFERVLYVWGCSKPTCQKKNGAIRAWRALRLDEKYAKKLQRKKERKLREEEARKAKVASNAPKSSGNPFSSGNVNPFSATSTSGFGFGDTIMGFGNEAPAPSVATKALRKEPDEEEEEEESSSEDEEASPDIISLTKDMEKTSFGPSVDWSTLPQYKPIYLETESEHLPPPAKPKTSDKNVVVTTGKGSGGDEWGKEMWEESQNVDDIFVRFTARVGVHPKQCVRYELDGIPLFYQAEAVYRSLYSIAPGTSVPVTGAAFAVASAAAKRTYNPKSSSMPEKCSECGSPRRFECQLMPNLINILKRPASSTAADTQMEWGTCLIFTCSKDCCLAKEGGKEKQLKECWREEAVLVQWEE